MTLIAISAVLKRSVCQLSPALLRLLVVVEASRRMEVKRHLSAEIEQLLLHLVTVRLVTRLEKRVLIVQMQKKPMAV